MFKEKDSGSTSEQRGNLPETVFIVITSFDLSWYKNYLDQVSGQPGSLIRWVIREKMEDEGRIPPGSDSGAEKQLIYLKSGSTSKYPSMNLLKEVVCQILRETGKPLHSREIAKLNSQKDIKSKHECPAYCQYKHKER